MMNHKGWCLENGYTEGIKTKAIRKLLDQLCWEIRRPERLLTGFDWIAHWHQPRFHFPYF
jgi:hypothetical protein